MGQRPDMEKNTQETGHRERLLGKLRENWNTSREIRSFLKILKRPAVFIVGNIPGNYADIKRTPLAEYIKRSSGTCREDSRRYIKQLTAQLRRLGRGTETGVFKHDGMHGLCCCLDGDNVSLGSVVLCGLKKPVSEGMQELFCSIVSSLVRECQKEIELEEINKTIRPRAIALSTVHTVHRLMTSTLDLGELLPRIARLSLQVIRANRCSIKLVDKKKKILIPKTTIDLRKEKAKLKKVEIGKYAPGRAVKKENPIRGKHYLACPMIDEEVVGVITLYDKLDGKEFSQFDEEIMKTLSEQAAIAIKNAQLFREQEDLTLSSIRCIARLLENRPHGVHRAEASFLKLMYLMGRKFNMNESEIKMLQYSAMLHDAGQISIPEKLLTKRGELTGRELDIIKSHPLKGANILSEFKPLKPIVPIILYHHENYDGSGYPKGLKGEEIPLSARVLAVVAAFEAMITKKPYRKAMSIRTAVKEVAKSSGVQFDPDVVEVFCDAVQRKDVLRLLERELDRM